MLYKNTVALFFCFVPLECLINEDCEDDEFCHPQTKKCINACEASDGK